MGSSKSQDFPCINNIWSLVSIDEYPFSKCQNLKAEMMEPSQVRKKALNHPLAEGDCCKVGTTFHRNVNSYILHSLLVQFLVFPKNTASLVAPLLRFGKNSIVDQCTSPSSRCPGTLLHHGCSILCSFSFSKGKCTHKVIT